MQVVARKAYPPLVSTSVPVPAWLPLVTFPGPPIPLAEESNPAAATVMLEKEQGKGPEQSAPHTTATSWDPNPRPPIGPTNPPALMAAGMAMKETTQAPSRSTPLSGDAIAATTTTA